MAKPVCTHCGMPAKLHIVGFCMPGLGFEVGDRVRVDNIAGQAKPGRITRLGVQHTVKMEDGRKLLVRKADLTKLEG